MASSAFMAYKVPEFGKWKHDITYTSSFENARKVRNSRTMMDPNNLHKQTDCFLENEASAQCPSPPQVETLELQGQQNGVSESQINRGYAVCLDKTQKKKKSAHSVTALLDRNYKVPEFGKWQNGENVTYTTSFENARRVSKTMDPSNNVNEFTDTFPDGEASAQSLLHQPAVGRSEPQGQQFEIREYGVQEAGNMGYSEDLDKAQNNKTSTYLAEKLLDQNLKVSKFSASDGAEKSPCVFFQSAGKTKKRSMLKLNDYPQNSGKYSQSGGHLTEDPPTQNRVDSRRHMSKVPQFGAWEKGDNVGYTIRFENARTIRLSGSSNDPKLNQDMHPPTQAHPTIAKPKPQAAGQHMKEIKFGAWQGGGEVSYTSYFNNVRKNNIKNASKARLERSDAPKEACSKVPQFGAWEGGESVEYTVYFDNARKNKIVGSRPYTFEPQLNDKTNRAQPPNGVTKARVEGTGNQTFGSQFSLYPREEKLQNRTAARRGYPISKVTKSGAWEDGTNFRAYCNVIERDSPVAVQLSLGRGNRKLFDSRVNKD